MGRILPGPSTECHRWHHWSITIQEGPATRPVDALVRETSESCEELWWGKKLSGVRVSLRDADPAVVKALVEAARKRKAPKRLVS
jgi:hypothetical protein